MRWKSTSLEKNMFLRMHFNLGEFKTCQILKEGCQPRYVVLRAQSYIHPPPPRICVSPPPPAAAHFEFLHFQFFTSEQCRTSTGCSGLGVNTRIWCLRVVEDDCPGRTRSSRLPQQVCTEVPGLLAPE